MYIDRSDLHDIAETKNQCVGAWEQVPRQETRFLSRGTKVSHNISALTRVTTYTHREKAHTHRPGFP